MTPAANRPLRVGLLGCSDIARRKFLPALRAGDNDAVLAAVASRTPERAAEFAPGADYRPCSYEELVADPGVDLIYLSLPNHLHEEWAIRALEAGKHVICEKPLGLTLASVERMLAAAGARGLLLYENLMYLHHPQHAAVREVVASGKIGRLKVLRSVFGFPFPSAGNFRLDPARGGGACFDLARYPLGTALHFLQGELREFRGFALDRQGLNVAMHGLARTTAEEIFTFAIAFGQTYESYYELVGEQGRIRVDRAYTPPADLANRIQVTCGTADASFIVPPADPFRLMLEHVCALVGRGGDFREAYESSRQLARLAEQMEKGCRDEN